MVPSGPPTPVGGAQPMPPSLLRSNSAILGGSQASSIPSQQPFSSLVSPRTQFHTSNNSTNNNMSLLSNISNVSSLLNNSFGNGGPLSGGGSSAASVNLQQRGPVGGNDMLGSAELDPLSFASAPGPAQGQHFQNYSSNQLPMDHIQTEHIDGMQNFQRQMHQAQLRGGMGAVGSMASVKLEPQTGLDKNVPAQNLQSLRSPGAVKLESQQLQPMRNMGSVNLERQQSDSVLFLQQQQQQQQQQQMMQMSRPSSQATAAQISLLQQQRIMQLQHQQQQQQILKSLPQQRNQLQQQVQQIPLRAQIKPANYEPGTCARRLTHYMYHQQHRPDDNNIEFWKKFVAEYFAPNAKKRWCVSLYGSGRQTTGVFPQDAWHCEICNRKPGRGFETTVEVFPRLLQIKYASGTLEELLYVDMPREYQNASGQIVLDYAKAIQESVIEQLRVVREGQLRIIFSPDLKICSWEFCARRHEELIPRRLLIHQVSQLGAVVQKYQNAAQNASSSLSTQDLQNSCNSFVTSTRQLAKSLEVPLVNDLGYTKRYVRCLQISEVVNCMKDLIDYSTETGTGPMDSLVNFSHRNAASGLQSQQVQKTEEQQTTNQNSTQNHQSSSNLTGMQLSSGNNGMPNGNSSVNNLTSTCTSALMSGLVQQNAVNARQENLMDTKNGSYGGATTVPKPSASSSNSLPAGQLNISSPFPSPTPSTSNNNNNTPTSNNSTQMNSAHSPANMSILQQTPAQSHEAVPSETQSTVQQILQELMMSSHINGVNNSLGNELKGINGITPSVSGGSCLAGNGIANTASIGGMGYGNIGMIGSATTVSGSRAAMANNTMSMYGRMNHISQDPTVMNHQHQQDISNRLMSGLPQVNNFNNLQFDWKPSP